MQYFLFVLLFVLLGNLSRAQQASAEPMHTFRAETLCRQATSDNEKGHYDHSCIAPEVLVGIQSHNNEHRIFTKCSVFSIRTVPIQPIIMNVIRIHHAVHPYCRPIDYYIYSLERILI